MNKSKPPIQKNKKYLDNKSIGYVDTFAFIERLREVGYFPKFEEDPKDRYEEAKELVKDGKDRNTYFFQKHFHIGYLDASLIEDKLREEGYLPKIKEVEYKEVVEFVKGREKITFSLIQRTFKTGYNETAKILERLAAEGIIKEDIKRPYIVVK